MKLGYILNFLLELSTSYNLQTFVCEISIKLLLSVNRDCCKSNLLTHLTNLPTTLQEQLRLHHAEISKLK